MPATPTPPGRIVAHRGASGAAPENTVAAFREAARTGARWVEFDVSLLGDGTPVVCHDATLDRCTDRTGPLSALSAGDLAGIDAGARMPGFAGEPLPTLAAALDALAGLGLAANLELKPHDGPPDAVARAAAAALAARGDTEAVLVSSFSVETLAAFRTVRPDQPLALLEEIPSPGWPERARALGAVAYHTDWRRLEAEHLAAADAAGLGLRVYTCNAPDALAAMRGAALSGVITDHPERFLADPGWAAWDRG